MHRLLRFYNQNRMKIWALILGVIFILLVIQVFNSIARTNIEKQNREILEKETTLDNVVSYDKQSESIISEEDVPEQYREDFGKEGTLCDTLSTRWISPARRRTGCSLWRRTSWPARQSTPTPATARFWPPCSTSPAPAPV